VYFRCTDDEHTVVTVSANNMAVTSKHLKHITKFKDQLRERFEISDLGELTWLLGLKIERDRHARTIRLSRGAYVDKIVERFRLEDAKNVHTPMDTGAVLTKDQSDSPTGTQLEISKDIPYQRAIGSLVYAATSTWPNTTFSVSILSQFMRNPARIYLEAVKQLFHYFEATRDMKLTLGTTDAGLEVNVDADWASRSLRHSMLGYIDLYEPAELPIQTPIPIYCDNQRAIALASNNRFHGHTKHIDLRYPSHFVRTLIRSKDFVHQYIPTDENLANTFTKPLLRPRLEKSREKMSVSCARGGVLDLANT
jgi:hypothetical protein